MWDTLQNEHNQVLAALGHETSNLDQLQQRTGLATATLQATLFELELGGHVVRHEGGRFGRLVRM